MYAEVMLSKYKGKDLMWDTIFPHFTMVWSDVTLVSEFRENVMRTS